MSLTGAQALDLLMARLKGKSNTTVRANALIEMQLVQSEYFNRLGFTPWFLKVDYTDAGFVTVADQEYISLPSGFLKVDEEWGALYYQDPADTNTDNWTKIEQGQYTEFKDDYIDETTGAPEVFDIIYDRLYLRRIPDAAYALRFLHYNSSATVADNGSTNLWLTYAASWLIAEAGFLVASLHIGDSEAATFYDAARNSAKNELYRTHISREVHPGEYQMGERP